MVTAGLRDLARRHGVQSAYRGNDGRMHAASPESLRAVLAALGVAAATPAEVADSLAECRHPRGLCEPVAVAWDGRPARITLRVPAGTPVKATLIGEQAWSLQGLAPTLTLPLPLGHHQVELEAGGQTATVHVIAAPRRLPALPRGWGAFLPLHALRSPSSWGCGHFGDLTELAGWVGRMGGGLLGTLPLHPSIPGDPSPYAPLSRLFWSELYLDLESLPEWRPALLAGAGAEAELRRLREAPRVDYAAAHAFRRPLLEAMAGSLTEARQVELLAWAAAHPDAADYARFRAYGEDRAGTQGAGEPWPSWPEPARSGRIPPDATDPARERYHLYAQWVAAAQLAGAPGLYLDLPLGVHPWGYDTWRHRDAFALGASMGAPPDHLFAGGQNWGMPPPHPARIRAGGYGYLAACLCQVMARAAAVRLDHVMSLHRLFWIPAGGSAQDGVYVRYRAEEMYAVLALAASCHGTAVVGEDLGTVPDEVRVAMARHGLLRMYVLPFARTEPAPVASMACLDTHDMPPFARWWRELADWERAELVTRLGEPPPDLAAALAACLDLLARSPADLVLVNLEDLWLETESQNQPGTGPEAGNWTRPAQVGLPEITERPEILALLRRLDALRREPLAASGEFIRR